LCCLTSSAVFAPFYHAQKIQAESKIESGHGATSSTRARLFPAAFSETVFSLKAMATLLVSATVLSMKLLPFYAKGTAWWAQGARLFLFGTFDFPGIFRVQFALAFAWPHFQQPHLGFQLAAGLFIVALQLFGRAAKWLLWRYAADLRLESPEPQAGEQRLVRAFALASWLPFRRPMEVVQAALEGVREAQEPAKKALEKRLKLKDGSEAQNLAASCAVVTVTAGGCLPLALAWQHPRQKGFGTAAGDDDVVSFCSQEGAMAFRAVVCVENKQVTGLSLRHLAQRCPWLVRLDFSGCSQMGGELLSLCF
jgi:hypothetical protein